MSDTSPPEPVDVDPNELRSGKFQLNPGAEQARRRRRWTSWLLFIAAFLAGYILGQIARYALHAPHTLNFTIGFVVYVVLALVLLGAFSGIYRLFAHQPPPEHIASPVGAFILGFLVEVYG